MNDDNYHETLKTRIDELTSRTGQLLLELSDGSPVDFLVDSKNKVIHELRNEIARLKRNISDQERTSGLNPKLTARVRSLRRQLADSNRRIKELLAAVDEHGDAIRELNNEFARSWKVAKPKRKKSFFSNNVSIFSDNEFKENWTAVNTSLTPNETWIKLDASSDDVFPASMLSELASRGVHGVYRDVSVKESSNLQLDVCARSGGRDYLGVWLGSVDHAVLGEAFLDVRRGLLSRTRTVGGVLDFSVEINRIHGSWFRFTVNGQFDLPDKIIRVQVNIRDSETGSSAYQGAHGHGIYVWGAELTYGST